MFSSTTLLSILGFLIILGPLVVVHEFGHYIFARIFRVKAEIFSIGFGPKLWGKQVGDTEWRISAVPLGGYVKLLGEDREVRLTASEQKRALHKQAAWKRFFIFAGGPLFNFLFAIVVFMAMLVIGEPQLSNVAQRVVHHSAAERAGFRSGDKVLSVNGKPVKKFEDIVAAISDSPKKPMHFEVLHPGKEKPVPIQITPSSQPGFSVYGESVNVGEIDGLLATGRSTTIGISNPLSQAGQAGLRTGDRVTEINGKPVSSWEEIETIYSGAPFGSMLNFKLERGKQTVQAGFVKPAAGQSIAQAWGLYSSELFVDKTVPNSPAQAAGLKSGDRLISVGSRDVESFFELRDAVQRAGEKEGKVPLRWERNGKTYFKDIVPTATHIHDPFLKPVTQFTVGVMPMLVPSDPALLIVRIWNPVKLFYKATERMVVLTYHNFVSIRKMITGAVPTSSLGGPIMIAKIAGEALSRGLIDFLAKMGVLSIGLGVLNILPVPVLDGGHLMLLAVESVRRKPLTIRQMEIAQGVGLILILVLMGIVFHNDLTRTF